MEVLKPGDKILIGNHRCCKADHLGLHLVEFTGNSGFSGWLDIACCGSHVRCPQELFWAKVPDKAQKLLPNQSNPINFLVEA